MKALKTFAFGHFLSKNDVSKILETQKLANIKFRDDILPNGDMWNGDNVIFTITSK
jgi:hypothetical protein